MTFYHIIVFLGIALGLWVIFGNRSNPEPPKTKTNTAKKTNSSKYRIVAAPDGAADVIDKETGQCVYEARDREDAMAWRKAHE